MLLQPPPPCRAIRETTDSSLSASTNSLNLSSSVIPAAWYCIGTDFSLPRGVCLSHVVSFAFKGPARV
jgi:hypothetical protein